MFSYNLKNRLESLYSVTVNDQATKMAEKPAAVRRYTFPLFAEPRRNAFFAFFF